MSNSNILTISATELNNNQLDPQSLDSALGLLKSDGFVVLENAVSTDHLEKIRERMVADIPLILNRKDAPFNWVTGNLQQSPPPFPPYLYSDILINPFAIQIVKAAFGRKMFCDLYSGNTAMPSDQRQPVHFDFGPLWPGQAFSHPPHGVVINVPVVPVSPENGATELWPGSHLVPIPATGGLTEEMLEEQRAIAPPIQPTAPLGSLLIRDSRLWHAGMPNRTQTPRPMIALAYWIEWFASGARLEFPVGTEELMAHPDVDFRVDYKEVVSDHIAHGDAHAFVPGMAVPKVG